MEQASGLLLATFAQATESERRSFNTPRSEDSQTRKAIRSPTTRVALYHAANLETEPRAEARGPSRRAARGETVPLAPASCHSSPAFVPPRPAGFRLRLCFWPPGSCSDRSENPRLPCGTTRKHLPFIMLGYGRSPPLPAPGLAAWVTALAAGGRSSDRGETPARTIATTDSRSFIWRPAGDPTRERRPEWAGYRFWEH